MYKINPLFSKIKLIVYDFDGVMTNNKAIIDEEGNEFVQVSRADGLGISEIKKLGIQQLILSTEKNPVVSIRAKKLKIQCIQNVKNKDDRLKKFCKSKKITLDTVAYVGNDINDLEVMKIVSYAFYPADAHLEVKKVSNLLLKSNGGDGVIRDLFDFLSNKE